MPLVCSGICRAMMGCDFDRAPSAADQELRERIKVAIQTAQDSDGNLLYVIPPGVAGMYADAVMRVFTERPYPH